MGNLGFLLLTFTVRKRNLLLSLMEESIETKKHYDKQRDVIIKKKGLKVLRFENHELNNIEKVIKKILTHLS